MINELRSYILNDPRFGNLVAFPDQYGSPVRLDRVLSEIRAAIIGDETVDDRYRAWVATRLTKAIYRDRDTSKVVQSVFDNRVSFLDLDDAPESFDPSVSVTGDTASLVQVVGDFKGYPGRGFFSNKWDVTRASSTSMNFREYMTGTSSVENVTFDGTTSSFVQVRNTGLRVRLVGTSSVPTTISFSINASIPMSLSFSEILDRVMSVQGVEDLVFLNEKENPDIPFLYGSQDRTDRKLWSIILAYAIAVSKRRSTQ